MALKADVETVILGCRNREKAEAAKASLEEATGRKSCFEVLLIDISNLDSIKKAVEEDLEGAIDCLILNAGGLGGKQPLKLTNHGTMSVFDLNVLGSVHLTDLLIENEKLISGHVLYVSSETARGIRTLVKHHKFTNDGTVEEFKSMCNGSCFKRKPASMAAYGHAKLVGTYWAGSMARKHPNIRFIAVSPGNTAGTNVVEGSDYPTIIRVVGNKIVIPFMVLVGRFHPLHVGAKRYLDVLYDEETFETGHFYASKSSWPTGRMVDQKKHLDCVYNRNYQDNANAAIHSYIKKY